MMNTNNTNNSDIIPVLDGIRQAIINNNPVAWNTWTPSWTNLTVGNGTVAAAYKQVGKTVFYKMRLTWGGTTSISGNVDFTIPVTSVAVGSFDTVAVGSGYDSSAGAVYPLTHNLKSTTVGALFAHSSAAANYVYVTSTLPITWATGDVIFITGTYEAG